MTSNLKILTSTSLCVVMNATFKIKHSKSKGMQEKESNMCVRQSLVMSNSDPRDGIFNPHLTPMKDSYNPTVRIKQEMRISELRKQGQ